MYGNASVRSALFLLRILNLKGLSTGDLQISDVSEPIERDCFYALKK